MSRSNPNANQGSTNPCKYFVEWKNGTFTYYDKQKEENVDLGHKITFLVLDELSTVKGWDDSSESGIYSNEVRDTRTDVLNVRSFKGGDIVSGLYSDIRDRVISAGGKYHQSIYCAMKFDGHLQLANVSLRGAALSEWSEFKKNEGRDVVYAKAVTVTGKDARKKGATKYEVPVFAIRDVSEDTDNEATQIDSEVLQPYLSEYLSAPTPQQESDGFDSISEQDAPPAKQQAQPAEDEDILDLPF